MRPALQALITLSLLLPFGSLEAREKPKVTVMVLSSAPSSARSDTGSAIQQTLTAALKELGLKPLTAVGGGAAGDGVKTPEPGGYIAASCKRAQTAGARFLVLFATPSFGPEATVAKLAKTMAEASSSVSIYGSSDGQLIARAQSQAQGFGPDPAAARTDAILELSRKLAYEVLRQLPTDQEPAGRPLSKRGSIVRLRGATSMAELESVETACRGVDPKTQIAFAAPGEIALHLPGQSSVAALADQLRSLQIPGRDIVLTEASGNVILRLTARPASSPEDQVAPARDLEDLPPAEGGAHVP